MKYTKTCKPAVFGGIAPYQNEGDAVSCRTSRYNFSLPNCAGGCSFLVTRWSQEGSVSFLRFSSV